MALPIEFGQIVWTEMADANGIRKARPAEVITPDDEITLTAPLEVVAITSWLPNSLPDDHVPLPWHAQRQPQTWLNRRCAAVCSWTAKIAVQDIQNVVGIVPDPLMVEIVKKATAALAKNPPASP